MQDNPCTRESVLYDGSDALGPQRCDNTRPNALDLSMGRAAKNRCGEKSLFGADEMNP
jgi:hypothetical protein